MRTIINTAVVLLLIMILVLGCVTWRYPFSAFSLYRVVEFDQDNAVVREYADELQQFKAYYQQHKKQDDVTSDRLQYILQVYQIPFLTNKQPMKITEETLEEIIAELRETRNSIIELAFTQEYDEETRSYLKLMLIDFLSIEEQTKHLKNATGDSRKALHIQIRNLCSAMESNLGHLETFYKMYVDAAH